MPEIIRALKDRSVLNKTAIAMKALGQIIASTGDVITPYARLDHRRLVENKMRLLFS
jgi:hypothetical protein